MPTRKPATKPVEAAPQPSRRTRAQYEAETYDATPRIAGVSGPKAPNVRPERPYLLVVYPERWGVIDGKVVPLCTKLHASSGVNNVDVNHRGELLMEQAKAQVAQRGGHVIPWDVDGPGTTYIRRVRATGSWISRWEQQHAGSSVVSTDEAGYSDWLRGLIHAGKIPAPPDYTLHALADELRQQIARQARHPQPNPFRAERLKRDLEAVERELEEYYADGGAAEADDAIPAMGD